ncbi:MAG: tetratricopeptide repeat protein [Candidatus Eisenbacteria sp.]|nr:tetratricopeptide repeat protein [Candidatus Eisenbacteria bacterium]
MSNGSRILMPGIVAIMVALVVGCGSRWLAGGKLHFDQERFDKALENFQKAVAEQPKNAEAHMWVGSTLAKLDRDEEAVAAIEKAEELASPELIESIANVRISSWSNRYNGGLADAKGAAEARLKGNEEEAIKKLKLAVDRFERAILFCPDSVKNYSNLGKVLFQLGDRQAGMENFERARQMAGERPELLDFFFRVFSSLGIQALERRTKEGYMEAVDMFERAASFSRPQEDMAAIYFNLGVANGKLAELLDGDEVNRALRKAIEAYDRVLEIDSDDTGALENVAYALMEVGEADKALEQGHRLLDVEPWNPAFHLFMGRLYNAAGDKRNGAWHIVLHSCLESKRPVPTTDIRKKVTGRGPGSDILKTLRTRGEPQQAYEYAGSRSTYDIWFYWTEGRVFVFNGPDEVFRDSFRRVSEERYEEIISEP